MTTGLLPQPLRALLANPVVSQHDSLPGMQGPYILVLTNGLL